MQKQLILQNGENILRDESNSIPERDGLRKHMVSYLVVIKWIVPVMQSYDLIELI